MDTQRDFVPFRDAIDELHALLRNGFKASDELVRGLWDALKDVPISEVLFHIKRIKATATKDTPFPRPRELRNHPHPLARADESVSERASVRTWEAMKASDPVRWRVEVGIARAARELAALSPDDPGFEDWTREYQRWASVRYAPRAEQERAVARYVGS